MTPEDLFIDELETFRKDTEAATPFFYAYVSIRGVAENHKPVASCSGGKLRYFPIRS